MKVAIVGGGVSGLVAARALRHSATVSLFEAEPRLGGHARTASLRVGDRDLDVETAFVIFNERAYPVFCALLDDLDVASRPGPMTFSVRNEATGLEYGGSGVSGLLAQPRNLVRPSFLRMVRDVLRFGREARELLDAGWTDEPLAGYVERRAYSQAFLRDFLVPMASAIWSAPPDEAAAIPACTFVRFFEHHGILDIRDAPQWRVVDGGSRSYVDALARALPGPVHLATPVQRVSRRPGGWHLSLPDGEAGPFDRVLLAVHADLALQLIDAPHADVHDVLSGFRYAENEAVVHTDTATMPRRRRAWASWNALVPREPTDRVTITYDMTNLQSLDTPERVLITLNGSSRIAPERVLERVTFRHPLLCAASVRASARWGEIDGRDGLHLCGAYWGYGFHEDGASSGMRAAGAIEGRP